MNKLIEHLERQKMLLWSLIDAQHTFKTMLAERESSLSKKISNKFALDPMECADVLLDDYEVRVMQIVPIQVQLQVKLMTLQRIIDEDLIRSEDDEPLLSNDASPQITTDESVQGQMLIKECVVQLEDIMAHSDSNKGDSISCPTCQKSFVSDARLKVHMKRHIATKDFQCDICSKAFIYKSDINRHILTQHSHQRSYKCKLCDRAFTQSGHLTAHIRTHYGDRPFECTFCARKFSRQTHLKQHIRTHTGEKPYVCEECDKGFVQLGSLKDHLKRHRGQKDYHCSRCSKAFVGKNQLDSHWRTHTRDKSVIIISDSE